VRGPLFLPELRYLSPAAAPLIITSQHPPRIAIQTPQTILERPCPWDPAGYYELKVDTNEDLVEDITWRFTFPVDSAGVQHVVVAELTGTQAADRNAPGRIITPRNAPVGEVLEADRGIKIFAGPRTDSFFNFLPFPITLAKALNEGFFPDLAALFPPTDFS
jgi:hypothetical protein